MKAKLRNKIPLFIILLITLLFAKLHANKRSDEGKDVCFNLSSDARGYYAWLPAIFIYHDLNFHFYDSVEVKDTLCGTVANGPVQDYRYLFNGKACDKYYPGTALMVAPFFIAAHLQTIFFSNFQSNGYTFWYFKIIALAAIFYYFLGMWFFLRTLDKLRLNILLKLLTILLVTFGSNMIYYIIDAPLYSHIYSFALIAAFLYYSFALKEKLSAKKLACISLITGMIFITRPVDLTILLVFPFVLGGDLKSRWNELMKKPLKLMSLLPVFIMPALLCILYKISTGHFFLYSYAKEGFDFLHPHYWQFLFHYDNGVFLYMPLMLMPFLFLFAWYKPENKSIIIGIVITLLITFYIQSSWWCWNYSFSFGARTMLDFIPLFGIVIGLSLKQANLGKHFYLLPVYFLCSGFTLLLYQQKSVRHYMGIYPITDFWEAIHHAFD